MKNQQPKTLLIELLLASIKGVKEKSNKKELLLNMLSDTKSDPSKLEKILQNQDVTDEWIKDMIDDGILDKLHLEKTDNTVIYRISNSEQLSEEKKREVLRDLITRIRLDPKDWKDLRTRVDNDWERIERIRLDKDWDKVERIRLDADWENKLDIRLDPDWEE
ncbi:hypothetical protein [Aquimarina sp. SS2-1]|uniref:hypothetical protein n=1 Tax=Aquimarina besae TaxID=3342247 RepID=UPI00366C909C